MSNTSSAFRPALGQFTTGVTIITSTTKGGLPVGVTANSFAAVSLSPPLVLWSLDKQTACLETFQTSGHYTVHILRDDQIDLSNQFAQNNDDKFDDLAYEINNLGAPCLLDYLARFECKTDAIHDGGDHVIFIGEVINFTEKSGAPLLFHKGDYKSV